MGQEQPRSQGSLLPALRSSVGRVGENHENDVRTGTRYEPLRTSAGEANRLQVLDGSWRYTVNSLQSFSVDTAIILSLASNKNILSVSGFLPHERLVGEDCVMSGKKVCVGNYSQGKLISAFT